MSAFDKDHVQITGAGTPSGESGIIHRDAAGVGDALPMTHESESSHCGASAR